jgi:hypothetical protein
MDRCTPNIPQVYCTKLYNTARQNAHHSPHPEHEETVAVGSEQCACACVRLCVCVFTCVGEGIGVFEDGGSKWGIATPARHSGPIRNRACGCDGSIWCHIRGGGKDGR